VESLKEKVRAEIVKLRNSMPLPPLVDDPTPAAAATVTPAGATAADTSIRQRVPAN